MLQQHYLLRLRFYQKRKDYMEGALKAEADKLSNQARFIMEKCNGSLVVENKKRKIIVEELKKKGYDPDPIKDWKRKMKLEEDDETQPDDQGDDDTQDEDAESTGTSKKPVNAEKAFNSLPDVQKYGYLLGMSMWMLTEEKKNELLKQRDQKLQELEILKSKSHKKLWEEDLDVFMTKLDEIEEKERNEELGITKKHTKQAQKVKGKKVPSLLETMPSPAARRVVPIIADDVKKKAIAANRAKENKIKKVAKKGKLFDEDENDEFDEMVKSKKTLKDKLGTPEEFEKKGKAKPKKTTNSDGMKQTKLAFKKKPEAAAKGAGAKGKPKKGKKNFDSDMSDNGSLSEDSNSDKEVSFEVETTEVKERSKRNVKAIKYNAFASGSEQSSSDADDEPIMYDNKVDESVVQKAMVISSESEAEEAPHRMETSEDMFDSLVGRKSSKDESPPSSPVSKSAPEKSKPVAATKPKPKPKKESDSDGFQSEEDYVPLKEKLKMKPTVEKKTAERKNDKEEKKEVKKRKKFIDSEDSQSEEDIFAENPLKEKLKMKPTVEKKTAERKNDKKEEKKEVKKRKKFIDSDDSQSEEDIFAENLGKKKNRKDDSDEDFVVSSKSARAKKPAKYNFDDSDSESD